jgi:hypothetical protein
LKPTAPDSEACYYRVIAKGEKIIFLGIGNIVALVRIIISVISTGDQRALVGAIAIFAVLWWDARAPWGRP